MKRGHGLTEMLAWWKHPVGLIFFVPFGCYSHMHAITGFYSLRLVSGAACRHPSSPPEHSLAGTWCKRLCMHPPPQLQSLGANFLCKVTAEGKKCF